MSPLPNVPWNTVTPASQDTISTVGSNQPDLTNDSAPGANDGHRVLKEHVESLRNKLQNAYLEIGTNPGNAPTSSLRYRVAQLEVTTGTDEKTKISATDQTQSYLDNKIAVGTGLTKSIINSPANEQLKLEVSGLNAVDFNEETFSTTTETIDTDVYEDLTNTPRASSNAPSGRAIDVYRNGRRMAYNATPTGYEEYNYESGPNRIHVKASGEADDYEVVYISGGNSTPSNFLDLADTPSAFTGQAGKICKVNPGADAIIFSDSSVGSHASEHEVGGSDLVTHDNLTGAGSNAHSVIDTHLGSTSNPHTVTAAQVGNSTAQWNADKLRGVNVHTVAPTDGQVLKYNNTDSRWEAGDAGAPSTHASSHEVGGADLITHDNLTGAGSNAHSAIDTHLGSTSNPHTVTAAQVGNSSAQWNADKLQGVNVHTVAPTDGQILKYNNTDSRWEAGDAGAPGNHASAHEVGGADLITHDNLTGAGSNAHSAIDTHLGSTSNPHTVTAAQVGNSTAQWNADKLQGVNVHTVAPTDGQVLTYNNTDSRWEAADASGGGGGYTVTCGTGGDYTDLETCLNALNTGNGGTVYLKGSHSLTSNRSYATHPIQIIGMDDGATINKGTYYLTLGENCYIRNVTIDASSTNVFNLGIGSLLENCIIKTKVYLNGAAIVNCILESGAFVESKNGLISGCKFDSLVTTTCTARIYTASGNIVTTIRDCEINLASGASQIAVRSTSSNGAVNIDGLQVNYSQGITSGSGAVWIENEANIKNLRFDIDGTSESALTPLYVYLGAPGQVNIDGVHVDYDAFLTAKENSFYFYAASAGATIHVRNFFIDRLVIPSNATAGGHMGQTNYVISPRPNSAGSRVIIENVIIGELAWRNNPTGTTDFGGVIGNPSGVGVTVLRKIHIRNANLDTTQAGTRYLLRMNGNVRLDNLTIPDSVGTGWTSLVRVNGDDNTVKNCFIDTSSTDLDSKKVFDINGTNRLIFAGNTISVTEDAAYGVYITASNDLVFSNNNINFVDTASGACTAVELNNCNAGSVIGNVIDALGGTAITYSGTTAALIPDSSSLAAYNSINAGAFPSAGGYVVTCGTGGDYTDLITCLDALESGSGGVVHLKGSHSLSANKTYTEPIQIIGIEAGATIDVGAYDLTFGPKTYLRDLILTTTTALKSITFGVSSTIENCTIKCKIITDESTVSSCLFETHSHIELKNSTIKNCNFTSLTTVSATARIASASGNNESVIQQCKITLPTAANEEAIKHSVGQLTIDGINITAPAGITGGGYVIDLESQAHVRNGNIAITGSGQSGIHPLKCYCVAGDDNITVDGLNVMYDSGVGVSGNSILLQIVTGNSTINLRNCYVNRMVIPANGDTPLGDASYVINSQPAYGTVVIENLTIDDVDTWLSTPTDVTTFGGVLGNGSAGGRSVWRNIKINSVNLDHTTYGGNRYLVKLIGNVLLDNLHILNVAGTAWTHLVRIQGSANIIKNCYISATAGDWTSTELFYANSTSNLIFIGNIIGVAQEATYGFYLSSASDSVISNNQFYGVSGTGTPTHIYLNNCDGGTVIGNVVIPIGGGGTITYAGTTTNMVPASGSLGSYNALV